MMSDLAEIAAAAGIDIIDTDIGNGADVKKEGETDDKYVASDPLSDELALTNQMQEWNTIFCNRYTLLDPDYASTVETADKISSPPCVKGFNCWRNRGDNRNWNRDRRGGHGDYGNRGNRGDSWSRQGGDGGGNWDRGDFRPHHHHRDFGDQPSRRDNDHRNWRNDNYDNRGHGYQNNRGNHGNYQNRDQQYRKNENQGHKDREDRDRSPRR